MPLRYLSTAIKGKIKLEDALTKAAAIFEAYVWGTANLSDSSVTTAKVADSNITPAKLDSGQYGGDYIKLTDTKATTVNGGSSSAGTQTRTLNTEDSDTGGNCTLSSNQFTLVAGTYRLKASAPAFRTGTHKLFLYNVSDAANEIIGEAAYSNSTAGNSIDRSAVSGEFNITSSKIFEIRHYTQSVKTTDGLGAATSDGTSEIYTVVELWKVK